MADRSEGRDATNAETNTFPEPHLEATQDLAQLAQEIAEAAVEEEQKLSRTPSPSPPPSPPHSFEEAEAATEDESEEETDHDDLECEDDLTHLEEEESREIPRPGSPVDDASWVLVDTDHEERKVEGPEQKFNVYRKFLARGDLRQKLADLGFTCDAAAQGSEPAADNQKDPTLEDLVVSCSESIVICHLPQEGEGDGEKDSPSQGILKDSSDAPRIPSWKGTVAGGTVSVEVERQGGLVVASVTVWHRDLLSALTSLRSLVSSAGLVSYADVDVTSLLARAA